jgi:hypothetical protein
MPAPTDLRVALTPEQQRRRIVSTRQASEILGLSEDTVRRVYPHLIKRISPRRVGIALGDVLDIASGEAR